MAFKTICLLLGIALACHAYPSTGYPNNFGPNQDKSGHNHNNIGHSHGNHHNFGQGYEFPNSFAYGNYPGGFGLNHGQQNNGGFGQNYGGFGQHHGYFHPNKGIFGLNEKEFSQNGRRPNFLLKSRNDERDLVGDLPLKSFVPVPFDDSKSFTGKEPQNHGFEQGLGGYSNNFKNLRAVPGNFGPNQAGYVQNHGGFGSYNSFGQNPGYFGENYDAGVFGNNGLNKLGQSDGFSQVHLDNNPNFQQLSRNSVRVLLEDPSIESDSDENSVLSDENNVITQSEHHHHHGHGHHGFGQPDFSNQQVFGQDNVGQNGEGISTEQNGFGSWYGQNGFGYWHGPWHGQYGFGPWQVQNGFDQEEGQNGFGQDNFQWPFWFYHVHGHHGHGHGHIHESSEEQSGEAEQDVDVGLVEEDAKPEDDTQLEDDTNPEDDNKVEDAPNPEDDNKLEDAANPGDDNKLEDATNLEDDYILEGAANPKDNNKFEDAANPEDDNNLEDDANPEDEQQSGEYYAVPYGGEETTEEINVEETV